MLLLEKAEMMGLFLLKKGGGCRGGNGSSAHTAARGRREGAVTKRPQRRTPASTAPYLYFLELEPKLLTYLLTYAYPLQLKRGRVRKRYV